MTKTVQRVCAGVGCALLLGMMGDMQAQVQAPKAGQPTHHVVAECRHGPSAFKRNFLTEITPLQEGVMDFKHYHTYTEIVAFLKQWAAQCPTCSISTSWRRASAASISIRSR